MRNQIFLYYSQGSPWLTALGSLQQINNMITHFLLQRLTPPAVEALVRVTCPLSLIAFLPSFHRKRPPGISQALVHPKHFLVSYTLRYGT